MWNSTLQVRVKIFLKKYIEYVKNTEPKCMYEIQEVAKCYLYLVFTCFVWIHPLRSKPIIKDIINPYNCRKTKFFSIKTAND